MLQIDIAVCGEHSPCSSHTGFAPYRGVCAFPVYTAQSLGCSVWSGPCVEGSSSFRVLHKSADSDAPAFCVFPGLSGSGSQRPGRPLPGCGVPFPSAASGSGSQRLGRTFPGCGAPFPSAAPVRAAESGLRMSLDRNRGPVFSVGGGGFSGAEFAPFPSPLLTTSSGTVEGSSLEFLSPFVLRTASSVFRLVNFSLLSHSLKKLPLTALRAFRPVLTLSSAARSSPFRPHLLVVGAGVWRTLLLGVAFRHVICGP